MKAKCPVCTTGKAKRRCHRHGMQEICSPCCAAMRNEDCGDCPHFAEAIRHQNSRTSPSKPPGGHFIAEVSDELVEDVNQSLDEALAGKPAPALAKLERLHREHPLSHVVCFGIGSIHVLAAEHELAIEWFDRALGIFPYHVESLYNKAVAHQQLLQIAPMIRTFRKVVEYAPPGGLEASKAREMLTVIEKSIRENEELPLDDYLENCERFDGAFRLMEKHHWADAARGFVEVLKLTPNNASTHGNLALCYAHMGRKADALASFDRALAINPNYTPAQQNRRIAEEMTEGVPPRHTAFQNVYHGG